jgi:FPC/CPF motif-containing protein YcgG
MRKVIKKHLNNQMSHRLTAPTLGETAIATQAIEFIQSDDFPCVGAKAALVQGNIEFRIYGSLDSAECETSLHLDLQEYVTQLNVDDPRVQSFAAIFLNSPNQTEAQFEVSLWSRLKGLSDMNADLDYEWSPNTSPDPENPHFSMSLAGHPFFIVGMQPGASRLARRSPFTMLVFNSNLQFNALKADGRYAKLQKVIRERDAALQGSINPNLADFGESSEARQYSGRPVGPEWRCPVDFEDKP